MVFKNSDPPACWYNIFKTYTDSTCELLRVEKCIIESILSMNGLIYHKVVKGNNIMSILKDNWRSFIAEYELNSIEIKTSKVTCEVDNSRGIISLMQIGKMTSYRKVSIQLSALFFFS